MCCHGMSMCLLNFVYSAVRIQGSLQKKRPHTYPCRRPSGLWTLHVKCWYESRAIIHQCTSSCLSKSLTSDVRWCSYTGGNYSNLSVWKACLRRCRGPRRAVCFQAPLLWKPMQYFILTVRSIGQATVTTAGFPSNRLKGRLWKGVQGNVVVFSAHCVCEADWFLNRELRNPVE